MYSINQLAKMAGVSTRTLRYYDEIDLLKPARLSTTGYRVYGAKEVERLHQILFYKALEMPLEDIRKMMDNPKYNALEALKSHHKELLLKRAQLDRLIVNVDRSIREKEGKYIMKDEEKFEGLKKSLLEENESKYGKEVKDKYGEATYEQSKKAFANLTKEAFDRMNALGIRLNELLEDAVNRHDHSKETLLIIAKTHKEWLTLAWGAYDLESHLGLVEMYVADERFKKYYDLHVEGCAALLKEAVKTFGHDI